MGLMAGKGTMHGPQGCLNGALHAFDHGIFFQPPAAGCTAHYIRGKRLDDLSPAGLGSGSRGLVGPLGAGPFGCCTRVWVGYKSQ